VRRRTRLLCSVGILLLTITACTPDEPGPTRVLLVGDSVMNQTGQQLRRLTGTGMDIRNEAVNGSGLLTPWLYDWQQRLPAVLDGYQPDIVVFLFVGNYTFGSDRRYETADGERVEQRGSDAFFAAWQRQARTLTERAAETAEVVWVLPPPMQRQRDQAVVDGLREGYQEIADEVEDTSATDAYEVLAEDGAYDAWTRGPGGDRVRLRLPDGVHLARTGARRLAVHLEQEIEERA